ncbi:hypothetical protein B2M20_18685 [Nitrobacter vulgaris]|uniref:Uncharacterized protein n=1 Tax=Nitrobacter vulgaris TaxID=29421 RepID=A0A1V4HTH8_NITVU|nr:hypothetical protein B2M20_18685 [Nitrobacter vulgaris]
MEHRGDNLNEALPLLIMPALAWWETFHAMSARLRRECATDIRLDAALPSMTRLRRPDEIAVARSRLFQDGEALSDEDLCLRSTPSP